MFNNIYKNKKVLITGHTGFKGSWLTAWLQLLGAEVVGISLASDTTPSHFDLLKLEMESYLIDIRDALKLTNIIHNIKPEILFHMAAQPLVLDSYKDPLYTFATNVMGTANLLNACRNIENLYAIVVVTSDKCYDNKEWVWGYREIDPIGGNDPYSASKGCAELVVSSFRNSFYNLDKYGLTHQTLLASVRAGNVIGGGDWAKDRLVPDVMRAIAANETMIVRNPNAQRSWQHVLECLSGYLLLCEQLLLKNKQFAESWNFAPIINSNTRVIDILNLINKYWDKLKYEIKIDNNNPHEANLLKLDCSKASALLQWKNLWNLDNTVKITTEWYRNFYENKIIMTLNDIKNYVTASEIK